MMKHNKTGYFISLAAGMAAVLLLFCVFLASRDDSRLFSAGELAGSHYKTTEAFKQVEQ